MTSARKNSSNMAWEPVFVSKGKVIDGKWQYEISIPLDNFGIKEFTAGQKFGIRVCRNWKRVTSDFGSQHGAQSSWSQDKCAFFSTDALPIMIYDPSAPLVSFLSVTKNGKADLKASVFNPTGKSLSLVCGNHTGDFGTPGIYRLYGKLQNLLQIPQTEKAPAKRPGELPYLPGHATRYHQ